MASPVVSSRTPVGQIINRDGTATFAFLKWMQNIGTTVNGSFDSEGAYQGEIGEDATIDGRETLASIVQNISTDGVVQGPGIDFALPYLNKDTDHIADGTGSPLAGGKEAYTALVASGPAAGETIRFDGSDWLPVAIAISKPATAHQWITSYDATTGAFTEAQPGFSDLSGSLDPSQLPATIAYTDLANTFTANQTINGDLAVTGNETVGGALAVTGNISAANFPGASSMVYPAAGIGVSTGAAWGTSLTAPTGALVGTTDTQTLTNKTVNGVAPATFTFIDPTASIQSQLNSKATYPATGIAVSTGTAWGTAIDPATVPRLNVANTFTGDQTVIAYIHATGTSATPFTSSTYGVHAGTQSGMAQLALVSNSGAANQNIWDVINTPSSMLFRCINDAQTAGNIWMQVDRSGATPTNVTVTGTFGVIGTKSFICPHPLDETKNLIHACLEGPENGVFYRGEAETVEGLAQVTLPDYFEALTFPEDRSIQLTQIEDGAANFTMMRASRITDGTFSIRTSEPSAKIAWMVTAVRRIGVDRLQVTQAKNVPTEPIPTPHDD